MHELLALCVRVDELANAAYLDMAERCTDEDVAAVLGRMAVEEASHVGWWRDLLDAFDAGLLPDMWTDSAQALERLRAIVSELESSGPVGSGPLDAEAALTAAARIEFFALDPVFAELLDLTEPAVSRVRQDAYARHVDRLIEAVERNFPAGSMTLFLANVLRRAQNENRALSNHATRDALTGLANRRALTTHLDQWTAWAARYGHPVTVLLIDVDRFKDINDTHGHLTGDEVLREVGAALSGVVRGADFAARYGGDEFAVIAPELSVADAAALAGRIQEAVRATAVDGPGGAVVRATVSVGVAVLNEPVGSPPGPADRLLAAADRSLYEAKQAGRNRAGAPVTLGLRTEG